MKHQARDISAIFGPHNLPSIEEGIKTVIQHPATSDWLQQALRDNLKRDAVDAVKDAEQLLELLTLRLNAVILTHGHIPFEDPGPTSGR